MKKLSLDPNALKVDSFATAQHTENRTVQAFSTETACRHCPLTPVMVEQM